MERSLVHIELIKSLNPIIGADKIETATVLGWNVVVKKDEFKVGDKALYFEIDSIVDHTDPMVSFLGDRKFRLKTIKLKGQISQGLLLPLSYLNHYGITDFTNIVEGQDFTEITKTIKWEPVIPAQLMGLVFGNFPTNIISKTDEMRIQGYPEIIEEFKNLTCDCYQSIKMDGTSCTAYTLDNERHICSRNMEFKLDGNDSNLYVKMAKPLNIPNGYGVQAEICGNGIQKNKMSFPDVKLMVFNVFEINNRRYLNYQEFIDFCFQYGMVTVPIIKVVKFEFNTVDEMLAYADTLEYPNHTVAEGVVIRPVIETYSHSLRGRLSIKAISNKFLLKHSE